MVKIRIRNLVLFLSGLLLLSALAVETVERFVIEPKKISSWSDCAEAALAARSHLPPLPLPTSAKELVARLERGDWQFVMDRFWYVDMNPSTLYIAEDSKLAKSLTLPLKITVIEDLVRGTITIYGEKKDGTVEGLALFEAPLILDETDPTYKSLSDEVQERVLSQRIGESRFRYSAVLKPESEAWTDIAATFSTRSESAYLQPEILDGGGMAMAMGEPPPEHANDLWLTIDGADLYVFAPQSVSNVEIYVSGDLVSNVWTVAVENLHPAGTNPATWAYPNGNGCGFFVGGNMDVDTDSDLLCDAREHWVTKTGINDSDSDDDALSDGEEVLTYGLDPNDADSDDDGVPDAIEAHSGEGDGLLVAMPSAEYRHAKESSLELEDYGAYGE